MTQDVEFEGTDIKLGRTLYVVPALGLGAVKKHAETIQRFGQLSLDEQMEVTIAIAHAALKRNYPDLTRERLEELVDLRNMGEVFQAVVQTSGFTAQPVGGGEGNVMGGASHPTGQTSTPT